jgi:flagellar hook-associated protein FlgK
MSGYYIGISGLAAAQKALDIIGNNMANAATEGYHKQRVELSPAYAALRGQSLMGGGVELTGVTRMIDSLLEEEIRSEQSILEQTQQEYNTMRSVESAFGEFSASGGLNASIDDFFGSLQNLSTHPNELTWQNELLNSADTMAAKFRTLSQFLSNIQSQITLEIDSTVKQINTLISRIAVLNGEIERIEVGGNSANNIQDQRDQCIAELSALMPVDTIEREYGVVDVSAAGIPVVSGTNTTVLESGRDEDGKTGLSVKDAYIYHTEIQGGKIGGLLSLNNELVSDVRDSLDELAKAIIGQINQIHTQGVGSFGSFSELNGWTMNSENLSEFNTPVSSGHFYIRVIDKSTGRISREEVTVDAATDTLTTIAQKISTITGLSASVSSSQLRIEALPGYEFDFSPAVLPQPSNSNLTGTTPPEIAVTGIFDNNPDITGFIITAIDDGSIGNETLRIEVRNNLGELVKTVNVGEGYAAGDTIELANGIKITIGQGDLNSGDSFEVKCLNSSDDTGLLAAAGLNCFFAGSSASDIRVSDQIADQPSRIATSAGPEMTDNVNVNRMFALRNTSIDNLGDATIGDYYRQLVTDIGQTVSVKKSSSDSTDAIISDLKSRQSEISGVDINDEAAQMLIFEKMFQAMAKYINTIQTTLSSLMEII